MSAYTAKQQLQNLADALVDDILNMTDEEVMAEALEELGSQEAVDAEIKRITRAIEDTIRQFVAS